MAEIIIKPHDRKARLQVGRSLLSYIQELGVDIEASCGGRGICGKCLVKTDSVKSLTPPTESEVRLAKPGLRLACQAKILKDDQDLTVEVPTYARYKILERGIRKPVPLNPAVRRINTPNGMKVYWRDLEVGNYEGEVYGLALDVGTTTLAMYWVNLETGMVEYTSSMLNPQIRYGDNVIDRINYSRRGRQGDLEGAVRDGVNQMILKGPVNPNHIYEVTVVGNTVMRDIFIGHPVARMGEAPFEPVSTGPVNKPAIDLGLRVSCAANVYALPSIGHFVGADALAVILATEIYLSKETVMAIDIGTNTEIAIGDEGRIMVTSCASGPAFEGSGIKCGTGAVAGAIQRIEITGDLKVKYETIDGAPPTGICGSGLIDALAQMLDRGIIDWKGRFLQGKERLIIAKNDREIFIDGEDIDSLKLAKSAISVGTKALMRHYGVEAKEISRLYLAGAFGNYIDPRNAVKIGMLPNIPLKKIVKVGNAAIEGAREVLVSQEKREEAEKIPSKTRHVRLEAEEDFYDMFIQGLSFNRYRV
ncbi:MAG: ASKHA domain-containing protein [Candidatus Bathyarchaeia archaeon]